VKEAFRAGIIITAAFRTHATAQIMALQQALIVRRTVLPASVRMFGRAAGIVNLTAPCIEQGFIQAELTGSGRDTDTFSKLQGLVAEFRRVLFAWLLTG